MAKAGEGAVDREALESVLSRTERGIQVYISGRVIGEIRTDFGKCSCTVHRPLLHLFAGCFAAGSLLEPGSRDHSASSLPGVTGWGFEVRGSQEKRKIRVTEDGAAGNGRAHIATEPHTSSKAREPLELLQVANK